MFSLPKNPDKIPFLRRALILLEIPIIHFYTPIPVSPILVILFSKKTEHRRDVASQEFEIFQIFYFR